MMHLLTRNLTKMATFNKPESKVFFESITSTVKGYTNLNYTK